MTNIAEFRQEELAQLDVALLPERETMLAISGSATAHALAAATGFTTSASTDVAAVVDNGTFSSAA